MLKAVLFDLDGVLIDTPNLHYNALNQALALFGYTIEHQDHVERFNGLPTTTKLEMLNIPNGLHPFIAEMKQQYTMQALTQIVYPDYQKTILLNALYPKFQLGCVSNALDTTTQFILERMGIRNRFTVVLGGNQIDPKPSPNGYLYAMGKLDLFPQECLIVEDSPVGIKSAKASGARVLEVPNAKAVHTGLFIEAGVL